MTLEKVSGSVLAPHMLVPYWAPAVRVVDELPPSGDDRGAGGFGSTGR